MDGRAEVDLMDDGFVIVNAPSKRSSAITPINDEKKAEITFIDHYEKSKPKEALAQLKNKLTLSHIKKPTALTQWSFLNTCTSFLGIGRVNQLYAEQAIQLINITLINLEMRYIDSHYFILTCLEKLLALYLTNSRDEVSTYIENVFATLLKMKSPLSGELFQEIKQTLFREMNMKEKPLLLYTTELVDAPIFTFVCSHEEYKKAEITWDKTTLLLSSLRPTN
jgi:hypothetical protein